MTNRCCGLERVAHDGNDRLVVAAHRLDNLLLDWLGWSDSRAAGFYVRRVWLFPPTAICCYCLGKELVRHRHVQILLGPRLHSLLRRVEDPLLLRLMLVWLRGGQSRQLRHARVLILSFLTLV